MRWSFRIRWIVPRPRWMPRLLERTQVGAALSPVGILCGHPNHDLLDVGPGSGVPRLAPSREGPLLGYQLWVPAEQSSRCEPRGRGPG